MKMLFIRLFFAVVMSVSITEFSFALHTNGEFSADEKISSAELADSGKRAFELAQSWEREKVIQAFSLLFTLSENLKNQGNKIESSLFLREASNLKIMLGDTRKAATLLEKSLKLERDEKNLDGEAETLALLSYVQATVGRYEDSNKNLNQAVNLLNKVQNINVRAKISYYAGEVYYSREDIPNLVKFYNQALELFRQSKDMRGEAKTLLALSYAGLAKDNISEGLFFAKESLNLWQSIGDTRGQALSLTALGLSQFRIGQSREALNSFNQSEKLFPLDIDKSEKAILIYNLGRVYENFGDCKQSIHYYKNSLDLFTQENNLSLSVGNLWTLGAVSYICGNKDEALDYLYRSLKLARKLNKKDDIVSTYIELGQIYMREGMLNESEISYQKARKILKNNKYKLSLAKVYLNLGELYEKADKIDLARSNYTSALTINHSIKNYFAEAETLNNLARIDFLENKNENALKLCKKSIDITESLSSGVLNSKLKRTYISNIFERYELYINLLMKMHRQSLNENYIIEALQAAERSRARSMLENLSLSEAHFTKDADAETVEREKEIRALLNTKADKLTDLLSQNAEKSVTDKISGEINELEHELEEIKATLKQNSPIYSAIKNPAPFDVAEFQRNVLDESSLLLEFSFGAEESYLWVIGKTEVDSYVLPARAQIESRIERLREMIASREMKENESIENYQARINEAENNYKSESKKLSEELFGQIADKISNKRLIIVPDGKLHYFPVAALPFPDSADDTPILMTNETVYEPSAATLALLRRNGERISTSTKNLLVFSDPIFSKQDARLAASATKIETAPETESPRAENFRFADSLTSLARLNAAKDEAEAIAEIVGESQSIVLSGAAATREEALETSVSEYKIIHFATHGLIDEERPELSGIVLSQFDEAGQTRNGVVRLQDIYAMNLSADAVVLSACSTGIGKEVRGEGLMSLNNAFLQAGAKSVVSSLWKVDDYAARELMKIFYREMASGTATTSEALRRAQIELRRNPQYQSPFYWAAFTVQGDFQAAPQISGGFDYRIFGLLIFPLALLGIYVYRRRSNHSIPKL